MDDFGDREWTTKDGRVLKWRDMTPSHLRNAASLLRRAALQDYGEGLQAIAAFLHGDMATYYAESENDAALEARNERADEMELYANERSAASTSSFVFTK